MRIKGEDMSKEEKSCENCGNNPTIASNDACACCYSTEDKTGNTINNYSNWTPIKEQAPTEIDSFEKWAIEKYGVRIKETDIKWWKEREEIWNACKEHYEHQVRELEREIEQFVSSQKAGISVQCDLIKERDRARAEVEQLKGEVIKLGARIVEGNFKTSDLQQRLDKAVEIIKYYADQDCKRACDQLCDDCIIWQKQQQAEKFLEANPLNTSQVSDKEVK